MRKEAIRDRLYESLSVTIKATCYELKLTAVKEWEGWAWALSAVNGASDAGN